MPQGTLVGPLPLSLGVTGHRDLRDEDRPQLRAAVASVLETYFAKAPHTPIAVLASLADGADRLVARVALDAGCSLVVPLPMPIEKFKATLEDDAGRAEFDELLGRASEHFVVPHLNETLQWSTASRELLFANCGAFIVGRCTELLALWDGEESGLEAGTSAIVRFMLEGAPEPLVVERSALDPALVGPVVQIVTPRTSNPAPAQKAFGIERLYPRFVRPRSANRLAFEELVEHIELFNADALDYGGMPAQTRAPALDELQAVAERISSHYQSLMLAALVGMLGLVFGATLTFSLYTHRFAFPSYLVTAYVAFTVLALVLHTFARRRGWQDRYQDYRSLGEALRVAVVWKRAGIGASVGDETARAQRGEVSWLQVALRTFADGRSRSGDARSKERPPLRDIFDHWVDDQASWYRRRIAEKRSWIAVIDGVASVAVITAIVLAVLPALPVFGVTLEPYHNAVFVVCSMLAVLAGLVKYYADKRGWVEETKEYARVGALFGHAREQLAPLLALSHVDPDTMRNIEKMLEELGREALRENVAWRNLHRQRPIEWPHMGA